jgi:hypothetical protein
MSKDKGKVIELKGMKGKHDLEGFKRLVKNTEEIDREILEEWETYKEADPVDFQEATVDLVSHLIRHQTEVANLQWSRIRENTKLAETDIKEMVSRTEHNFKEILKMLDGMAAVILAHLEAYNLRRGAPLSMKARKEIVEAMGFNWKKTAKNLGWAAK